MNTQENKTTENKKPDYQISLVKQTSTGDEWANIGVGWVHNDADGMTFAVDFLRLFGLKLVSRKIKIKEK